jgi:hypothetical protein
MDVGLELCALGLAEFRFNIEFESFESELDNF